MSTNTRKPGTFRRRWLSFTVTSSLMGLSFAAGAALTGFIAFRLLLPIAVTGMAMGFGGMVSSSASATTNALYAGDSETRLAVLTQLDQTFAARVVKPIEPQVADWILPAIKECQSDADPAVVDAATGLEAFIVANTAAAPK